jgi:serine protease
VFLPGVTKSWTHTFKTIESLDCDVEVTPVAPVVNQSTTCDVEGSYTIPSTEGVDYYVGGVLKAPGTYSGPINATVTATAKDGYELDNPEWSAPIVIAAAEKCPVRVTPESPTVLQSEACEVEGSFTVPTTGGVEYLLGDQVVTGTVTGPVTGTLTARALPGHVLTNPEWSYSIDIPAAEDCPVEVVPVEPTVVQSEVCEIEGTYTIPATTGLQYLLDDEPIAAGDYTGPVDGVVTAQALPGYVVSSDGPWSYDLVVAPAADCPPTATPVAPTVAQSEVCDVEGTYTIPVTPGVQYLLDGVEIAAGDYTGPKTGTLTAEGVEGTVLTDPEWSFDLDVLAAADCPEVLPTEEVDVCTNIAGPQSAVPAGYTEKDGVCTEVAGTETEKPTPEVLGVQQEVPTAVNAGLGDIAPTTSSSGMLGQGLLGGGMVMLLLAAWLKFGRVERGAHQV